MKRSTLTFVATLAALTVVGGLLLASKVSSQTVQPSPPKSRLGIYGVMGFIIVKVEPGSTVEQVGLKPGDIITELNDQITTSIQEFQNTIVSSAPGTSFDIEYLRFNPATGKAEPHKATVTTMSLPSGAMQGPRNLRVSATTSAPIGSAQSCWCCDRCVGFSPNKICNFYGGFTGYVCFSSDGFRCRGAFCA